jgi:hypothetical protein
MRTRTIVGLVVVAGWWIVRGDDDRAAAPPARLQAAVIADGFALLDGDARRVVELDRGAVPRHEMRLRLDTEVRLVGTKTRTAVGWQDGRRVKFGDLDGDGNPEDVSTWGTHVTRLCDGAATSEHRFGIGWLESNGVVHVINGPASGSAEAANLAAPAAAAAPAANVTWCGVASAEHKVALVWRDGDRWHMSLCAAKRCGLAVRLPIEKTDTLLGFGCVADGCLFATRDQHGAAVLSRVTERAKIITKPLEPPRADTAVSIVGAGGKAFAVAYAGADGRTTVRRITVDGAFTGVWHFDDAADAPSLAWARGTLLVALTAERMYALDMAK